MSGPLSDLFMAEPTSLENVVLFAFRQALAEGRLDVADHLLAALERMAEGEAEAEILYRAYRLLVEQTGR